MVSSSELEPADFSLERLIRPNILKLQPYRCARDDYSAGILLDANENALGPSLVASTSAAPKTDTADGATNGQNGHTEEYVDNEYVDLQLNRYPDPVQGDIKQRFADYRNFRYGAQGTFLGVGSDEIIDLLIRITCKPGEGGDRILVCPPTYGMYSVCACVNDVEILKCPLILSGKERFLPDMQGLNDLLSGPDAARIKLLFLTSPGNPTGTAMPNNLVRQLLNHPTWRGLVILDEAYIDFSSLPSSTELFDEGWQNLVVMQTLSKGFGLAGIRIGVSFQSPAISQILANTKAPYSIGTPTASIALKALNPENLKGMQSKADTLKYSRSWLLDALARDFSDSIGPALGANDANFVLVPIYAKCAAPKLDNVRAAAVYKKLAEEKGVVVRFRGNEPGCEACVRITVGTQRECEIALEKLRDVLQEI